MPEDDDPSKCNKHYLREGSQIVYWLSPLKCNIYLMIQSANLYITSNLKFEISFRQLELLCLILISTGMDLKLFKENTFQRERRWEPHKRLNCSQANLYRKPIFKTIVNCVPSTFV